VRGPGALQVCGPGTLGEAGARTWRPGGGGSLSSVVVETPLTSSASSAATTTAGGDCGDGGD